MRLVSIQCGLPREVDWNGTPVLTSIFKEPVEGRLALRTLNLDGDRQSDLSVHGGRDKAVYCYPLEHYVWWRAELGGVALGRGAFGENFTTEGLIETEVHIGDRLAVGSAEVEVTQPRMPCFKLGIKFGSDAMVKRFLASGRPGFYVRVKREGEVGAGDAITLLDHDAESVAVTEIVRLYVAKNFSDADVEMVRRALAVEALTGSWKEYFAEKLERMGR